MTSISTSLRTFPKFCDKQHKEVYKKSISYFKYNHKVSKFYDVLIEGENVSERIETYETCDALMRCRHYFELGIETKAYFMPNKVLFIDYAKPFAIEKTYDKPPVGKQL